MESASKDFLWGKWAFFGFYYKGKEMDPINPKLHIEFEFRSPKTAWLKYWREDEKGQCERLAVFELLKHTTQNQSPYELYQQVTWVNPENRSECAKDPDMQFGRTSWTPIELSEKELNLVLPLGEENLTYRFKRKSPEKTPRRE